MRVFSVRMKVEFPELLLARTQIWTMTSLRVPSVFRSLTVTARLVTAR